MGESIYTSHLWEKLLHFKKFLFLAFQDNNIFFFFTITEKELRYSSADNKKGCRSRIISEQQQRPSAPQMHQQNFESSWKDGWELVIPLHLSLISL